MFVWTVVSEKHVRTHECSFCGRNLPTKNSQLKIQMWKYPASSQCDGLKGHASNFGYENQFMTIIQTLLKYLLT